MESTSEIRGNHRRRVTAMPARLGGTWWVALGCRIVVIALASTLGALLFAVATPVARASEACPNEAIRSEQGVAALALPECRAYELVTPPDDHPNLIDNYFPMVGAGPGDVEAEASAAQASVAFKSWYSPSGSPSAGHFFDSIRGKDGWSTRALDPPLGPQKAVCGGGHMYFPADLEGQIIEDTPSFCSDFEPPLATGESRTSENLLVHAGEGSSYELLNKAPEGIAPGKERFQAASIDLSHVLFSEEAQLTPEAPVGDDLYEWNDGVLQLVTRLPDGAPVQGMMADGTDTEFGGFGNSPATLVHSASADGERVIFDSEGVLYLRVNAGEEQSAIAPGSTAVNGEQCTESAKACTIQLDVSRGTGASGGGEFWRASMDDSRIFFTDENQLTSDSTAAAGAPDLYEYALATHELTDLTVNAGEAANVQGVAGASQDGSYIYFVAKGVLSTTPNSAGATAERRKENLYLRHAGVTSFIATLNNNDKGDWGVSPGLGNEQDVAFITSETSLDGRWLAFNSIGSPTGYENAPAEPQDCWGATAHAAAGEPCGEIFLFDADGGRLRCVSCGPLGSPPTGVAQLRSTDGTFARRALSADGSVFFDTPSALLGQDSNGVYDVYEWSPEGVGGCGESSSTFEGESGGCLYSISSGTSLEPSYFVDASESSDDAYFMTSQGLVAADTDNTLSLYDARVDGGFPAGSGEAVQVPECESAEACKPPAGEAPAEPFPASAALSAGGNLIAPPVPVTPAPPAGEEVGKPGLTRAQRLARALRACRAKPRRKRASCQAAAHGRYGGKAKSKSKGKAKKSEKGGRR